VGEGAVLAVIIVLLFLGSFRSTIITGLTLPIALLGTLTFIWAFGFTINMMTLLALSLCIGLLIDDAIVVRENIVRHAEMGKDHVTAALEGTKEIGLAVLAMQLDEQVAAQLLKDYPADQVIDNEMMRQTLIKLDQYDARLEQLSLLDDLGGALDKYMRSFIMHTAFKMCKGAANKYRFELMYDFIGEGFIAMKPMKSAANFIHTFTVKEREIVEKVHAGEPNPFY